MWSKLSNPGIAVVIFLFAVVPVVQDQIKKDIKHDQELVNQYRALNYEILCVDNYVVVTKHGELEIPFGRSGKSIPCENVAIVPKPKERKEETK